MTARLLRAVPRVYLGPDAFAALDGSRGVLLGAQRPGWVDVLDFQASPGGDFQDLSAARLDAAGVGVAIPASEARRLSRSLVRELVPGDVVLTNERGRIEAWVHQGDRLAPAPLEISRTERRATSARRYRRRR